MGVADELTKLIALRDSGAITQEEFDRQRAILFPPRWGPQAQADPGMECGRCHEPLSPAWKGKCNHGGASYSEFEPVPRTPLGTASLATAVAEPRTGDRRGLKVLVGIGIGIAILVVIELIAQPLRPPGTTGGAGATRDYASEFGGSPTVYAEIARETSCSALQASFDEAAENNDAAEPGTPAHRALGFMTASLDRMDAPRLLSEKLPGRAFCAIS